MPALSLDNHQEIDCCGSEARESARYALEKKIAFLENGQHAIAFSSGLMACCAITKLLCPGDEVLVGEDIYGGSYHLIENILARQKVRVRWVDTSNSAEIEKTISKDTKLLWLESPSNPLLRLADLSELATLAKHRKILTVADNTLATSCLQKPLDFGADIVLHSSTKNLSGCAGISGGILVTSRPDLCEELQLYRKDQADMLDNFDCVYTLKGMQSLTDRVCQQEKNTKRIANFLSTHKAVLAIYYPGLSSHPQHELAAKQMNGFGSLLSFELTGGAEAIYGMIRNTRLFAFYEKMANVGSKPAQDFSVRSTIAHAKVPAQILARYGGNRTRSLARLIVGLENADELIADLDAALRMGG